MSLAGAVPENGGEVQDLTVYDFKGAGGVALSMYNTDEVSLLCGIIM